MSSSSSRKKITLISSDGESFHLDESIALQFESIEDYSTTPADTAGAAVIEIRLPNVTSKIVPKVIEYCKKHAESSSSSSPNSNVEDRKKLKNWDAEFITVDKPTLFDLIKAAEHLKIKGLLQLATQTVADIIKGKTAEEMYLFFNSNEFTEFTPEEEKVIRKKRSDFF